MSKKKQTIEEMAKEIHSLKTYDTYWADECRELASDLYARGWRKQSEWISVDERLPEDGCAEDRLFEDFHPIDCLLAAKVGDRIVVDWGTRGVSQNWRTGKTECYWEILHDWDEARQEALKAYRSRGE